MSDQFHQNWLIKDCLANGSHLYFDIETIDLWLNIQISLSLRGTKVFDGKAKFKFSKSATLGSLRKKLQIFGNRLWCHKNMCPEKQESNRIRKMDAFKCPRISTKNKL